MAWNRPNREEVAKRGGSEHRNVHLRGLFAGAIVIVVGAVALLYFASTSDIQVENNNSKVPSSQVREVKPTAITKAIDKTVSTTATKAQEVVKTQEEKKPGVFAPGMIRLPNGLELRFKLPAEGETRQVLAGGKIWEIDSKGNIENVTPPPIFEKPFEGMLSALYERDGLVLPFQLKQYSEKEVRKMCKEPTLSYDDDTPEITRKRENVVMLKKAVLEFLDAGGKFEEFVDDMSKHSQNAQIAQVTGVRDIHDLLANGKDHEALQYYKVFSEEMAEKGYGELRLPRAFKEALEEQLKLEEVNR